MEVDCAYDGEEAYEKAKANAYDMILFRYHAAKDEWIRGLPADP